MSRIGQALKETLSVEVTAVGAVPELVLILGFRGFPLSHCSHFSLSPQLRGIRYHFTKMLKSIKDESLEKAQLGLGHRCVYVQRVLADKEGKESGNYFKAR